MLRIAPLQPIEVAYVVGQDANVATSNLYAKLGYVDAGLIRCTSPGVIILRGRPFEVDDTLVYLTKTL